MFFRGPQQFNPPPWRPKPSVQAQVPVKPPPKLQPKKLEHVEAKPSTSVIEKRALPKPTQVVKTEFRQPTPNPLVKFVMRCKSRLEELRALHLWPKLRLELTQLTKKAKKEGSLWITPWNSWQPDKMDTIARVLNEQAMAACSRKNETRKSVKRKREDSSSPRHSTPRRFTARPKERPGFKDVASGICQLKNGLHNSMERGPKSKRLKVGKGKTSRSGIMNFNPRNNKMQGRRARFHSKNSASRADSISTTSSFELGMVKLKGVSKKLEKEYFRLLHVPTAEEVRSRETCEKAFEFFKARWESERDYVYMLSMLKALKQDLQVQGIRDQLTVAISEFSARVALEVNDLSEFNSTASHLRGLYRDARRAKHSEWTLHQPEFDGYQIYYLLTTKNFVVMSTFLKDLSGRSKSSEIVRNAVELVRAVRGLNSPRFFSIWFRLGKLNQNLLTNVMWNMRYMVLKGIISACSPQAKSTYPVADLLQILGFKEEEQVLRYLKDAKAVIDPTGKFLKTKLSRAKVIEVKPEVDEHEGVSHGSLARSQSKGQGGLAALRYFLK